MLTLCGHLNPSCSNCNCLDGSHYTTDVNKAYTTHLIAASTLRFLTEICQNFIHPVRQVCVQPSSDEQSHRREQDSSGS